MSLRVLGIGNLARRDDGVGVWIARQLAARLNRPLKKGCPALFQLVAPGACPGATPTNQIHAYLICARGILASRSQAVFQRPVRDKADVRVLGDDGFALLDALAGVDEAILIDAVQSGAAPGTLHRFDAAVAPLPPDQLRCSTHLLGIAEAIELARALGQLPARLVVYGIEGADFGIGEGLSAPVAASAAALVETLVEALACGSAPDR